MYYSGIDLHKHYMVITTIDDDDKVIDRLTIRSDWPGGQF
mgnify:CR=1 FL=1